MILNALAMYAWTLWGQPMHLEPKWSFDVPAAEVLAWSATHQRLLVVAGEALYSYDTEQEGPVQAWRLTGETQAGVGATMTHVALSPDGHVAAVTIAPADVARQRGAVAFVDIATGVIYTAAPTGFGPDAVAFLPCGSGVVVVNEGEARVIDGAVFDPPGSLTVIRWTDNVAQDAGDFVSTQITLSPTRGLRLHPDRDPRRDIEPESITITGDRAFVTLQENNGIAVVDLAKNRLERLIPLGSVVRKLDPSDQDELLGPWAEMATLPMPDQIASFEHESAIYLVTADEGDDRGQWSHEALGDSARLSDLADSGALDDEHNRRLEQHASLGRLTVCAFTRSAEDGIVRPHALGARSLSVWHADTGQRVGGTGHAFENLMSGYPEWYNSTGSKTPNPDSRSDNRGPEPEGVVVAEINGAPVAFVGLERPGAVAIVVLSRPDHPRLTGWHLSAAHGWFGIEGLCYVPSSASPLKAPTLFAAFETSGTVVAYEICSGESQ